MRFLVTCEHGSSRVPESLAGLLGAVASDAAFVCPTGFDVGARQVSRHFAQLLSCPLVAAPWSPLVVDCNRPASHREVFSAAMRQLPPSRRERILREVHAAHQQRVRQEIEVQLRQSDAVVHLAIHSFAPFDPGAVVAALPERCKLARRTDLGLLYDPRRPFERELCEDWAAVLYHALPMLRVRRNYPLRGTRGGLIQSLRREYPPEQYLGIEVQLNQAWCARPLSVSRQVVTGMIRSLAQLCGDSWRCAA